MLKSFHVPIGHLYVFFEEMSTEVFCQFFKILMELFLFLLSSCMSCLNILEIKPWYVTWFANIFLPVCRLSFHFVYGFLCCAKAYEFD